MSAGVSPGQAQLCHRDRPGLAHEFSCTAGFQLQPSSQVGGFVVVLTGVSAAVYSQLTGLAGKPEESNQPARKAS